MRPAVLWIILLLLLFHHFEVRPQTRNTKSRINPVSKRSQQDFCPFARREPRQICFTIDTVDCTVRDMNMMSFSRSPFLCCDGHVNIFS